MPYASIYIYTLHGIDLILQSKLQAALHNGERASQTGISSSDGSISIFSLFHELIRSRDVRRPSICLSVNILRKSLLLPNGRIATKLARDGLQTSMHPGSVLKVKVEVKGHVI